MDTKRLENIRDFIINEIDCGNIVEGEWIKNPTLDIEYIKYNKNLDTADISVYIIVKNINCNRGEVEKVFDGIKIGMILYKNILNISISKDVDFKVLNRKRKLWMLKD